MEDSQASASAACFEVFERDNAGLEARLGAFETHTQAFSFIDERRQRHPHREHRVVLRAPSRRRTTRDEAA